MENIASNWYAIYVKSRHESVAYEELQKKGVESYLPVVKRMRRWKDRRKMVEFPLFPGYLFVRVNPTPSGFVPVLRARGVVCLVSGETGTPLPVPEREMDSLRIMIDNGGDIDIYPGIKEGARIEVKSGPFKGANGTVVKKEDGYMLMVNIDILGRSIGVKLYADDLEGK